MNADLIQRIAELDEDLASETAQALRDAEGRAMVERARENLGSTISRYAYDMTGQDGEAEIEAAARDYCDAQSAALKERDPERWAEKRYFGLI